MCFMAIITKYPLQNLSLKDSDLHIDLWRFVVFFFFPNTNCRCLIFKITLSEKCWRSDGCLLSTECFYIIFFMSLNKEKIKFLKHLLEIGLIILILQSLRKVKCFSKDLKTRKAQNSSQICLALKTVISYHIMSLRKNSFMYLNNVFPLTL